MCVAKLVIALIFIEGAHAELTDLSTIGNCSVVTNRDPFDDTTSHMWTCRTDRAAISFLYNLEGTEKWHMSIQLGSWIERPYRRWDVAIRVDRGEIWEIKTLTRGWHLTDDQRTIFAEVDPETVALLLNELGKGERVAVKIGSQQAIVNLTGSMKTAEELIRRTNS